MQTTTTSRACRRLFSSSSLFPIVAVLEEESRGTHRRYNPLSLHALSLTTGALSDPFACSRLLDSLLRHGPPATSRYISSVFDSFPSPDEYTWNALISAHVNQKSPPGISLSLYFRMRGECRPSLYTFSLLAKACGGALMEGKVVHAQAAKCGAEAAQVVRNSILGMYCGVGLVFYARRLFDEIPMRKVSLDVVPWNTMISGYSKNGDLCRARKLFDVMPLRNLVSWSAMIDGYISCNDYVRALSLFLEMERETDLCPDIVVLISALKACANLGEIGHGRRLHQLARLLHPTAEKSPRLAAALIDMYSKCGYIDAALEIFNAASSLDVVIWNVMISGLAMHGRGVAALDLFHRMKLAGAHPNGSTFIAVLRACSHAGLIKEGREAFASMEEHGVDKKREHYGCFADLLARGGLVEEAEEVLRSMPMEAEAAQWGAVMAACRVHGDDVVGSRVGPQLIAMEPEDGGRYVLMANTFAAVGKWYDVGQARTAMEESGARKEIGRSLVKWAAPLQWFACLGIFWHIGDLLCQSLRSSVCKIRKIFFLLTWLILTQNCSTVAL